MNPDSLRLAVEHQGVLALGLAFLTGLLFSISPVAIASVPVALAYVTKSRKRTEALRFGAMFVMGLIITHVLLGVAAGLVGRSFEELVGRSWGVLLGPILILLGLVWVGKIPIRLPALSFKIKRPNKAWGAFLLSIPFSVAVCPICTPALVVLLGATAALGSAVWGGLFLLAFALGRAVPIMAGAMAVGWLEHAPTLDRFRRPFEVAGGVMFILSGLYMLNAVFFWVPALAG